MRLHARTPRTFHGSQVGGHEHVSGARRKCELVHFKGKFMFFDLWVCHVDDRDVILRRVVLCVCNPMWLHTHTRTRACTYAHTHQRTHTYLGHDPADGRAHRNVFPIPAPRHINVPIAIGLRFQVRSSRLEIRLQGSGCVCMRVCVHARAHARGMVLTLRTS